MLYQDKTNRDKANTESSFWIKAVHQPVSRLAFLLFTLVVLASCNSDTLNVVPNAGDPTQQDLSDSKFLTDDAFAPKIASITLYDICTPSSTAAGGFQCNPDFGVVQAELGQKAVNAPVRVLVTMDKPVYLDAGTQADIGLTNADFRAPAGLLQPIIAPSSINPEYQEPANDRATLQENKFLLFTTEADGGHILPQGEGEVTVTIPAGLVYAVNVNDKKIYNAQSSYTFDYDITAPVPVLRLIDEGGVIDRTGKMSARSADFGKIFLEIDWGEPVTIAERAINVLARDDGVLSFSCTSQCVGGFPVRNKYIYYGNEGQARTYDEGGSTSSKYKINLTESDTSGDFLNMLRDGTKIEVSLAKSEDRSNSRIVKDAAGNLSVGSVPIEIEVDASDPVISTVSVSLVGSQSLSDNTTVVNIGDTLRFTILLDEPVAIFNEDDIELQLGIGSDSANVLPVKASINFAASLVTAGTQSSRWVLDYTIKEGDGNNALGPADPSNDSAFTGDRSGVANWYSDLSYLYNIVSDNKVFDEVGNPIDSSNFFDQSIDSVQNGASNLNNLHIDGRKPNIETSQIESLSKRASGDLSRDTNTVVNGGKLAIAVPFSEDLRDRSNRRLSFNDRSTWANTNISVSLYRDAGGQEFSRNVTLSYDHQLTLQAQTEALFLSHPNVVIYSIPIDSTFERTESLVVDRLSGLPAGVAPNELLDIAGNTFNGNQAQTSGFTIDERINLSVDGGPFRITSIYPMYSDDGVLTVVPEAVVDQFYAKGQTLYVGMELTRDISVNNVSPSIMTVSIQSAVGAKAKVDVTSDSAQFAKSDQGDIKNIVIYGFNLRGDYEDNNGIEVKSLVDPNSVLIDENQTILDTTINPSIIRGGTSTLNQVRVDTKAPLCNDIYLTDQQTGSKSTAGYVVNISKPLYLSVNCDQQVVLRNRPSAKSISSDTLYVNNLLGVDSLSVPFTYFGLFNGDSRILYSLPILPGYKAGDGYIVVGDAGDPKLTRYVEEGVAGEFNFFTDPAGNPVDIETNANNSSNDKVFVYQKVYDPLSTDPNRSSGITIDTTPLVTVVRYKLPDQLYFNRGAYYIPGGTSTRADGKNTITLEVDYGFFDADGNPQPRALQAEGDEDLSIDVFYIGDNSNSINKYNFSSISGNTVIYKATFDYTTNNPVNTLLESLTTSSIADTRDSGTLPFTTDSVVVYGNDGVATSPVQVNTPISVAFTSATQGLANFPQIRINNTRPKLESVDAINSKYPIEIWRVDGTTARNFTRLEPSVIGGNLNSSIRFSEIYFALVFDKDMSEDSFSDTNLVVDISTDNNGTIPIRETEIAWVSSVDIASQIANAGTALAPNKVFYRFSYGDSRYTSSADGGFLFTAFADSGRELLTINSGVPQDVFANEVELDNEAYAGAVAGLVDGYKVSLQAEQDIASVSFDKDYYKYGDQIEVTIVTKQRINTSLLNSSQRLAVELSIDVDEDDNNSNETRSFYLPHIGTPTNTTNGGTSITFRSAPFSDIAVELNDDNTSDSDGGISFVGSIRLCSSTVPTASNCTVYTPDIIDAVGTTLRQAGLGISEVTNVNSLAGINTVFPKIQSNASSIEDLMTNIFYQSAASNINSDTSVNDTTTLRTGDLLIFELPVTLQNRQRGGTNLETNSLQTGTDRPRLHFSLANIAASNSNVNSDRQVPLTDITADNRLRFEYTIQNGDFAGTLTGAKPLVYNDGTEVTTGDLSVVFDLDKLISSIFNANRFAGYVDSIYGNPLLVNVVDLTGDVRNESYPYVKSNLIDTRPYITEIVKSDATRTTYVNGDNITFRVDFSEAVNNSGTPVFKVSFGGSFDTTADYQSTDASNDADSQVYGFKVPVGASGDILVTKFEADGQTNYIRNNSGVNLNPNLGSKGTLGIGFSSTAPTFTDVRLTSGTGIYSNSNGNSEITIELDISKPVKVSNVTPTNTPEIRVHLDLKGSGTTTKRFKYTGGNLDSTSVLKFSLKTSDFSSDEVQDYDGITFLPSLNEIDIKGATIEDAGGTSLDRKFNHLRTKLNNFNVDLDTSRPKITEIIETKGNSVGAKADYSSDEIANGVVFKVTFDEIVDLSTTSSISFQFDASLDNSVKKAGFDVGLSNSKNADQSIYYFKMPLGNTDLAQRGIFDINKFTIATGAKIIDKADNDLVTSLTATSKDFSQVYIDTEDPSINSVESIAKNYAKGDIITFDVIFNEIVNIVGTDLKLNLKVGSKSVVADFTQDTTLGRGSGTNKIPFVYTVKDGDQDLDGIEAISINQNSSFIYDNLSNSAKLSVPAAEQKISGVFVSENPTITKAVLKSAEGIYSKNASSVASKLRIALELSAAIDVSGITPTSKPSFQVALNTKSSTQLAVFSYDGGNANGVTELPFELELSSLGNDIQDYNGLARSSTQLNVPSTVSLANSVGETLVTDITSITASLADLTVDIDTSFPTITSIVDTKGGSANSIADYSSDAAGNTASGLTLRVTFDETVDLSATTGISIDLSFDNRIAQASLDSSQSSNSISGRKVYFFKAVLLDNTDFVSRGNLEARSFDITGTQFVRDLAGNQITANNGISDSVIKGVSGLSGVRIDTVSPSIASVDIADKRNYSIGESIEINVQFSENVVLNTAGGFPYLRLRLESGDVTADYKSTSGSNTLVFSYTTKLGDKELLGVKVLSAFLNNSTIRDGLFNSAAQLTIPSSPITISGVTISDAPSVSSASLTSAAGIYSKNNSLNTIILTLDFTDDVHISGAGPTDAAKPTFTVDINKGDGSFVPATFRYSGAQSFSGKSLPFSLDVSSFGDDIEDYDGLEIKPSRLVLNSATIVNDASVDISTALSDTVKNIIKNFNVSIDTKAPVIVKIDVEKNDYSADAAGTNGDGVSFKVTFDETVDLSSQTQTAFYLDVSMDTGTRKAEFDLADSSGDNTDRKIYYFTMPLTENIDQVNRGNLSVKNNVFSIVSGVSIKDKAGNLLIQSIANAITNFSSVAIDTIHPYITAVNVGDVKNYTINEQITFNVQFNENLDITSDEFNINNNRPVASTKTYSTGATSGSDFGNWNKIGTSDVFTIDIDLGRSTIFNKISLSGISVGDGSTIALSELEFIDSSGNEIEVATSDVSASTIGSGIRGSLNLFDDVTDVGGDASTGSRYLLQNKTDEITLSKVITAKILRFYTDINAFNGDNRVAKTFTIGTNGFELPTLGFTIDSGSATAENYQQANDLMSFSYTTKLGDQEFTGIEVDSLFFPDSMKATDLLGNNAVFALPSNPVTITGATISDAISASGATLISSAGIYSKTGAQSIIKISLDFSQDININGVGSTDSTKPSFSVLLDKKDGNSEVATFIYSGASSLNGVKSLEFSLSISGLSNDVNDYNGIGFNSSTSLSLKGASIKNTLGVDISTFLGETVKSDISGFNVSIDTSKPTINRIDVVKDDYSADAAGTSGDGVSFKVTFDETVDLSSSNSSSYSFDISMDTSSRRANFDLADSSNDNRDRSVYYFTMPLTLDTDQVAKGNLSIINNNLIIANGATIQDKAGNSLNSTSVINSVNNLADIRIDTIRPRINSIDASADQYLPGENIRLGIVFDENVSHSSISSNSFSYLNLRVGSVDTTADVISSTYSLTSTIDYNFSVPVNNNSIIDNDGIDIKALILSSAAIVDQLGNPAIVTIATNLQNLANVKTILSNDLTLSNPTTSVIYGDSVTNVASCIVGTPSYSISSSENDVSVDTNTGKVTAIQVGDGNAKIIINCPDVSTQYASQSTSYDLIISKADIQLSFANATRLLNYDDDSDQGEEIIVAGLKLNDSKDIIEQGLVYTSDNIQVVTVNQNTGAIASANTSSTANVGSSAIINAEYQSNSSSNYNDATADYQVSIVNVPFIGSSALYSLRKVPSTNYAGPAIQIRSNLDATVDIPFDNNGNLDIQSINNFIAGSPASIAPLQSASMIYSLEKVRSSYSGPAITVGYLSLVQDIGFDANGELDLDQIATFESIKVDDSISQLDNTRAIYSLRKVRSSYAGMAVNVRNASDVTMDIGFDASGDLDDTALLNHVGSGDGFVTIWYDQSGNGADLIQANSLYQPKIATSGIIEKNVSGTYQVKYQDSFMVGKFAENVKGGDLGIHLYLSKLESSNNWVGMSSLFKSGTRNDYDVGSNLVIINRNFNSNRISTESNRQNIQHNGVFNSGKDHIISVIGSNKNALLYVDRPLTGNSVSAGSITNLNLDSDKIMVGSRYNGSESENFQFANFGLSELRIFNSDTSADRLFIEGNMSNYWRDTTYDLQEETKIITWHDQSTLNNDATQSDSSLQPSLELSDEILQAKSNGKPLVKFSGNQYLEFDSSPIENTKYSIFASAGFDSIDGASFFISTKTEATNQGLRIGVRDGDGRFTQYNNNIDLTNISPKDLLRPQLFIAINGANGKFYKISDYELNTTDTADLFSTGGGVIGATIESSGVSYFTGHLGDVLVFDSDQTNNVQDIETYMRKKYNHIDAHVIAWYDQSNTGIDLLQPNNINQPKIVINGKMALENGLPAIDFDSGRKDFMASTQSLPTANNSGSSGEIVVNLIHKITVANREPVTFNLSYPSTTTTQVTGSIAWSDNRILWNAGSTVAPGLLATVADPNYNRIDQVYQYRFLRTNSGTGLKLIGRSDGKSALANIAITGSIDASEATPSVSRVALSALNQNSGFADMRVQEFSVFLSEISSTAITSIESDQRTYWFP